MINFIDNKVLVLASLCKDLCLAAHDAKHNGRKTKLWTVAHSLRLSSHEIMVSVCNGHELKPRSCFALSECFSSLM